MAPEASHEAIPHLETGIAGLGINRRLPINRAPETDETPVTQDDMMTSGASSQSRLGCSKFVFVFA